MSLATHLFVQRGDWDGRVPDSLRGRLIAVRLEKPDNLDVGDLKGHPLEGHEHLGFSWT